MLLYTMLYIVLAYLMLFAALTNSVCLNNASFFFLFKYFLCQGYELSGEIALKNNHYYYYYYLFLDHLVGISCDIALMISSLRSCHLVSTELGEWVVYIPRAFLFNLILVLLDYLQIYNFLYFSFLYLGYTSKSTTTTWW